MMSSKRYLTRLAKLRKEHRESPLEEQVELAGDAFRSLLAGLPGSMASDIFESVADRVQRRMSDEEIFLDEARYLADVADLFCGAYDEEADPIHDEDWQLIGEIVNDYALDLEMETVNYVMRFVVEHHGI